MQSAWGTTLADMANKSWAEDAMEEEAEHGQIAAPEARVTPPLDENVFPELGAQAAASKGGGGKKGKRVKGRKMAMDEFNSAGGGHHLDERARLLNALPKHATGEEMPDRFNRGGGMGHRPRMDDEPSKADGSDNWGSDRIRQPPRPGGFGGGGGGGGFGGGGGGFSRAEDEGAWSRGGGMGPPAPRRNGFGGGPPRDDEGGAWSRGTQRPQMPERPDRGGFGASRANEEGAWSRGTRAPEPRGDGGRFSERRADEETVWARGAAQQPPPPTGDGFRGAASQADDVSTWARKEPRERPPPVHREVPVADAVDNWTRGKPGPVAARRPGRQTDSPRNSPRGSGAGSEKSGFASPREARESRDSHKSAADEAKTWGHNPQAVKKPHPHPREGRWGKQEAPIDRDPPKRREERTSKPEHPSPKMEVEESGEEEQQLQLKLAELQLRQEAGEGDADSQDVGEDGALISIDQAYDACKRQIDALAAARHAKAQEGTAEATKWAKAPRQQPSVSESATETAEKVETAEGGDAEEGGDDEGFSEVVSRASAKREKAAAKAAHPASGRGSSGGGGKAPATSTPPRKASAKW